MMGSFEARESTRIHRRCHNRRMREFERFRDGLNSIGFITGALMIGFGLYSFKVGGLNFGGGLATGLILLVGLHTFFDALKFSKRKWKGRLPEL